MSPDSSVHRNHVTVDQFRPRSQARSRVTDVPRARYPLFDAHNHYVDEMDFARTIDTMDACNVRLYVDLSGYNGDHLKRRLDLLKGSRPERFAVFYVPDFKRVGEPGFGEREARDLEQAKRDGVQGVKIFKSLGLTVRDDSGTLVPVDDPRLDPIWETAGRLGLPVLIHVADPWAFFDPMDEHNERYHQLVRHPDWHFYGPQFPPLADLLAQRDHIVERHPETTFIGAHVGSEVEDLRQAAQLLDRCPNYCVDVSAREAELGRQPRRAREFIAKYQDRVLFGTDALADADCYRSWFRTLETDDDAYEYHGHPWNGFWAISALDLPDDVLRKVYATNAERVIPGIGHG